MQFHVGAWRCKPLIPDSVQQDHADFDKEEIVIVLLGEAGSGKSSFIQRVIGSDDVKTGHGRHSGPLASSDKQKKFANVSSGHRGVEAYSISVEGCVITLIDTPSLDVSKRSDVDVLREVSEWLTKSYKSQRRLVSGIMYLFPITPNRLSGSTLHSLEVFAKLVGLDAFGNVVLVTTRWDQLPDKAVGVLREDELREKWWSGLIQRGMMIARSDGDRQSALAIVKNMAFSGTATETVKVALAMDSQPSATLLAQHRKRGIRAEIGVNELLLADLPSPYSPRDPSWITAPFIALTDMLVFSLSPMIASFLFLKSNATRFFRPQIQKDYSRIEWICVSKSIKMVSQIADLD